MTLYILNYNNYYNRRLKRENTLEAYLEFEHYSLASVNFNPNDGVDTSHVMGTGDYDGRGDYLLVVNERGQIQSRWFIIEAVRNRAGQYQVILHRDLLVDYYSETISAPAFIEKAIVPDSNPLIYNSERMSFNQIKKGELLIKDKSQCPWIVGYYAKNTPNEHLSGNVNVNVGGEYDILINVPFSSWEYNATVNPYYIVSTFNKLRIYIILDSLLASVKNCFKFSENGQWGNVLTPEPCTLYTPWSRFDEVADKLAAQLQPEMSTLVSKILTDYADSTTYAKSEYFLNLHGKVIKDSNGEYYRLAITPLPTEEEVIDLQAGSAFNDIKNAIERVNQDEELITGYASTSSFKAEITRYGYTMSAEKLEEAAAHWDLTGDRQITEDAPYNIFAIPMGSVKLISPTGTLGTSSEQFAMATAESIIRTMSSNLYDIQLLPYCPSFIQNSREINVKSESEYALITGPAPDKTFLSFILNVRQARFSKYIEKSIQPPNITKISNEVDLYKLCSPNWASEFQFSVVKNGGVSGFDIDCEYRPYTPYIHVAPRFGGLYGRDFNDARGLICSGDFSLTQIEEAWKQYQISNKNFQNIFDRQIENMEVQHRYQRIGDIAGAVTGTVSGAGSGAMAGTMVSPGIGTAVGAALGGTASAIGGVIDYNLKEELRHEALDYSRDMFGYQLDNIRALPYTLTKVTAYNNNNKIFPVLEYYTCTEVERKALAHKIAYNSMTIGVIGTVEEYMYNSWYFVADDGTRIEDKGYIKAQLIRLDDIAEDFHVANAIAGELSKGVYFK